MTSPKDSAPTPAPVVEAVAPAPVVEAVAVSNDVCADCGSSDVVSCTDGVSAERRCYCSTHIPANVAVNSNR